jgi:hypothetical protein
MLVVPEQVAVSQADNAFNADGSLKDAKQQASVEKVGAAVAKLASQITGTQLQPKQSVATK